MRSRVILFAIGVALWFALVVVRLVELQIARHGEFVRRAERQQQRVVELDPPRGTIYDRRGRELAVSIEVDSVFAVPREIGDREQTAAELSRILHLDRDRVRKQLSGDREFVWVARKVDPPMARAVRARSLPGIYFLEESKRYYPLRETAAGVLGFVGVDNHGLAGIEAQYEKTIAGRPGRRTVLRDARAGQALPPDLPNSRPVPGRDLHLTIDASLQFLAELELERAVTELQARSGSLVLLDPHSGAVWALASAPGFDANQFAATPAEQRRLRPIQDSFEPGSTFKILTFAAGLEQGLIDPDEVLDCEMGGITLAGVRIRDHHPFGRLSVRQVLAKSSNVGTIKMALRISNRDFDAMIRAFGFGRATGIDLPGENPGLLRTVERWSPLEKVYLSFGQGISASALQMAVAFAAVANGGLRVRPHVVASVSPNETQGPDWLKSVAGEPVISRRTAAVLADLLEGVTAEGGTGSAARIAGYRVAGKTGTAQKAVPGRGYLPDEHVASFVGFAPVERPVLVAAVVLDAPQGRYHGGQVAAPIFSRVVSQALLYLGVTPERERPERWPREQLASHEGRSSRGATS